MKGRGLVKYKILEDLVKFNTINDIQNKEIINYIEKFLLDLKFKTEYKGKYLIMSIGKNPKLGFLGHTDTVKFIDGWNSNPYELTYKDGNLYGLGTCDMKGGIAAILDTVAKIDFSKLKNGIKLYFTYDEEIGFGGIYDIVNSGEKFPDTMIFGEPTNNEILVGSKGLLEFELLFNGIKVHASNPTKGKSANMNAVKCLYELDNFYNNNIKAYENNSFEVPFTTMNVGIINGGIEKNSVSASCSVCLEFRIAKNEHIDLIKEKIEELAKKYDANVKVVESIEPFINKTKFSKEIKTANFMTEASLTKCKEKIILGTGPATAHEVNEHITEESYNKLIKQYKDIIMKVCK